MKNFKTLIDSVIGVVPSKPTVRAYGWALCESKNGTLSVICMNSEVQIKAFDNCDQDFSFCVDAKKLSSVLSAMPEDINLKLTDKNVVISKGKSRFQLATSNVNDFPLMESISGDGVIIEGDQLKTAMSRTSKAMAMNDVRYFLNGMYVDFSSGVVASTDGHRLSVYEVDKNDLSPVIIPRLSALEIFKLIQSDVRVNVSGNFIAIESDGIEITAKLIDGKFPDYQAVIPKEGNTFTADAKALRATLKRINAIGTDKIKSVSVKFSDGLMSLKSVNKDNDEAMDELECGYRGDKIECGFNTLYMMDAIDGADGEISITVKDANSPAKIQPSDKETQVVMPMRI